MTPVARLLRLDRRTWQGLGATGTITAASLATLGAFAVFAFDRFGIQALVAPRPTLRLLLTGFYGWVWLAGTVWIAARFALASAARFDRVLRLFGYAHLPLLAVALTIQVTSVTLRWNGPGLVFGWFTVSFWMPALLVAATRQTVGIDTSLAVLIVAGPYVGWLLVIGRTLASQLGHLL